MSENVLTQVEQLYWERIAYVLGKREINSEKNKKTKLLVEARDSANKNFKQFLMKLLKTGDTSVIPHLQRSRAELEKIQAQLKEARKPYNEKLRPLSEAIRYIDAEARDLLEQKAGKKIMPAKRVSKEVKGIIARRKVKNKNSKNK